MGKSNCRRTRGQKSRQGQRSDLKKALQPQLVLDCKEESVLDKFFSQLRPGLDEVVYFPGRLDVLIANLLNLKRYEVHCLKKVIDDGNPRLIAAVDKKDLTLREASEFVGLPADLQDTLLEKSRPEQIAGIKAWKAQLKQGGETEKK